MINESAIGPMRFDVRPALRQRFQRSLTIITTWETPWTCLSNGRLGVNSNLEDRIRERAYFLWLDASKAGDATYFWLIAEREVLAQVAIEAATNLQLPQAAAKRSPGIGEHQSARRVNALVQLAPGKSREQTALDGIGG
ncbi:MAG: DUF2934 domain-containing protein [Xanthobacteraceae bacterium]